ncbi:Hypothetical predicted protein [Podarcis lilfordi]|uniref:Uncharacterized protein n=1 Tax=Podarcis lilfordi TaxID=74358 RepID=A0AA35LDD3_9SAUR|nr:Hypothetical predicted protein [Podarcis lilfordi]
MVERKAAQVAGRVSPPHNGHLPRPREEEEETLQVVSGLERRRERPRGRRQRAIVLTRPRLPFPAAASPHSLPLRGGEKIVGWLPRFRFASVGSRDGRETRMSVH